MIIIRRGGQHQKRRQVGEMMPTVIFFRGHGSHRYVVVCPIIPLEYPPPPPPLMLPLARRRPRSSSSSSRVVHHRQIFCNTDHRCFGGMKDNATFVAIVCDGMLRNNDGIIVLGLVVTVTVAVIVVIVVVEAVEVDIVVVAMMGRQEWSSPPPATVGPSLGLEERER